MTSNGNSDISGATQVEKTSAATPGKIAAQIPVLSKEEPIGSWFLLLIGPYQKYIEALSGSNPGLKKADPNNKNGPLKNGNALVVLLDAPATSQPGFETTEFKSATDLRNHFQHADHDHDRRRIYIMEGLAPDYVSIVGGHFFMEPTFFQRQERTCVWSNDFTPVSDALPQPSLLDPEKSFHLQYCELRQFNKAIENRYYFCQRTRRHVGMTAPRHKEESTTGILRRKVSWWCRRTAKGGWDVVILCDPQLLHLSPDPKEVVRGENNIHREIENVRDELKNGPFQEGYVDFLPPVTHDKIGSKKGHPHTSMLRDLIHYYQQHSDMLSDDDWNTPNMSAVFLKKIVAAHYLQLVDYIKAMLPSLELRLTTAWVEEQDQWKSLQTISRRCGNYRDDIEDTLLSLGYPLDGKLDASSKMRSTNWKDCEKDFNYVYFRLKILKERADNLMQAMTGLASIAGNRQNLEEAKRVKRLNLLALLFIPLAYTSSLFSMQDNYAPNRNKFWVYWISAIGAVAITAAVTWILDNALDDEAQWTWRPLKYLKFWEKGNKKPGVVKRKATGFYDQTVRR
ncbi:Nn.00g053640.m01.CDS01 [Neocucurbitaria sp. VM-36]